MIERGWVAMVNERCFERDVNPVGAKIELVMVLILLRVANNSEQLERRCRKSELCIFTIVGER